MDRKTSTKYLDALEYSTRTSNKEPIKNTLLHVKQKLFVIINKNYDRNEKKVM